MGLGPGKELLRDEGEERGGASGSDAAGGRDPRDPGRGVVPVPHVLARPVTDADDESFLHEAVGVLRASARPCLREIGIAIQEEEEG